MLKGSRKEFIVKKNRVLELKNYTELFFHNQGSNSVHIGGYKLEASEKYNITTHGIGITEDISIDFNGVPVDNLLYVSAIILTDCN
ncbi:hypothetical protein [Polaribacter aestuariivivens]|uniref:hypothetical protein n=1 Tax=Polaribacter aestuariivivens TaxID=2304626 RepID=UPI003F491963